jgi:hypothetical protein
MLYAGNTPKFSNHHCVRAVSRALRMHSVCQHHSLKLFEYCAGAINCIIIIIIMLPIKP